MNPHPRGELSLRISLFRLPLVQCTPPYTTTFDGVTTSSMAHEVQRPDDAGTIHHSEKQATTELLDVNQGPRQNTSTSTLEANMIGPQPPSKQKRSTLKVIGLILTCTAAMILNVS